VAAGLLFALQLDAAVGVVVGADAVLLSQKNARRFFRIGGMEVVLKIQTAQGVAAVRRVGVQLHHRPKAAADDLLLGGVDEVFPLVAVTLSLPHTRPPRWRRLRSHRST